MSATGPAETGSERRQRLRWRLALPACLPLAAAAALALLAWSKASNTLAANGRWVATKTIVGKSLLGAESFFHGRQALAGGVLNPGAWHGFHEVLLRRPVDPRSLELDVLLTDSSYLVTLVHGAQGRRFSGVRLSLTRHFPNVLVEGDGDGLFTARQAISPPLERKAWQRLRLDFAGDRAEASLDGKPFASIRLPARGPYRLGFRSGFKDVYIDNVRIEGEEGVIVERFGWPPRTAALTALAALAALGAGVGLFASLARRRPQGATTIAAYFGMIGSTLAVMAGLALGFVVYRSRAPHYPPQSPALHEQERAVQRDHLKVRRQEVLEAYADPAPPGTLRVLVLGTSQTWGSGARAEAETFVAVLEDLLAEAGASAQCINAGVSAATAPQLARVLKRSWLDLEPDVLVINLGNNDRDAAAFETALGRMLDLAEREGIEVLLVREANSTERNDRGLITNHAVMERLGAARSVPVVDMHRYLARRRDDGFLWWDKVHLTTFGQRLVAERLAEELLPRLARLAGS